MQDCGPIKPMLAATSWKEREMNIVLYMQMHRLVYRSLMLYQLIYPSRGVPARSCLVSQSCPTSTMYQTQSLPCHI
jgi:hypothetical protein